ncbi:hypothetical protein IWZ03DRAFT_23546 [Phyllosticta citriasiana]|uniref:Aminoglycoside phosphotransferase domain-containing protein n=2 Tax=Phyllosticta citriasiana TaxID=595635 RepID=A0ABR1KZV7_9PEZI
MRTSKSRSSTSSRDNTNNAFSADPGARPLLSEDMPSIPEDAIDLFPRKLGPRILWLPSSQAILKKGPMVRMAEAEAMRFVRPRTKAPVPEVYQAFVRDGIGYILMERMRGLPLEERWKDLDPARREKVVSELREYVQEWRQLRGEWFGTLAAGSSAAVAEEANAETEAGAMEEEEGEEMDLDEDDDVDDAESPVIYTPGVGRGGPCEDLCFKHLCLASPSGSESGGSRGGGGLGDVDGSEQRYGPYRTKSEYNSGVVKVLRNSRPQGHLSGADQKLAARILANDGEDKVWTHGDFILANILVEVDEKPKPRRHPLANGTSCDDDSNDDGNGNGAKNSNASNNLDTAGAPDPGGIRVTGILDWEAAGFSPTEREYCEARSKVRERDKDWRVALDSMFDADVRAKWPLWREIDWALVAHSIL